MKLTIFTPTYNRPNELLDLYDNIKKEVTKIDKEDSVEWLIIDDGSKEKLSNADQLFEEKENFCVIYKYKKNGGKHTAFNQAIDLCAGDIFVCIDDDDRLSKNSLIKIFQIAKKYENHGYGGIVGRVEDLNGNMLGKTVFPDTLISNTVEIRDKYKFWGEPEVYYSNYLKKYRFDIFPGERFLTEAYLFDEMSNKYPFVYTNEVLMIKHYLEDGLTSNQLRIRIESPHGSEEYYYRRSLLCTKRVAKLKAIINRQRFAYWITDINIQRPMNLFEFFAYPLSFCMYLIDKRKYTLGKKKKNG